MVLGSHLPEETKAKISAACMGRTMSIEARAKLSVAGMGNTNSRCLSEEGRLKMSLTHKGTHPSLETLAKQSAARMGHAPTGPQHHTVESRAKMSKAHMGYNPTPETRAKLSAASWKGGRKMKFARHDAKRRLMGLTPLNSWFTGCEGHHVDNEQVIYMSKKLHRSVYHRQDTGRGMAQINAIAYNFLFKQEVKTALGGKL